jgi:hypothetical protein
MVTVRAIFRSNAIIWPIVGFILALEVAQEGLEFKIFEQTIDLFMFGFFRLEGGFRQGPFFYESLNLEAL